MCVLKKHIGFFMNFAGEASLTQTHNLIPNISTRSKIEVICFLSEEKKKMYYYYGGKEKKAGEIKKQDESMMPFRRDFEDFWSMTPRWMRFKQIQMMMPKVDVEDRGKDYKVTADFPGYGKEDVNIEIGEDMVKIDAKKTLSEEEKNKNYFRQERMAQTFCHRIALPEKIKSDDAKASLKDGILEIILPKKEPKKPKNCKSHKRLHFSFLSKFFEPIGAVLCFCRFLV